MKYLLDVNALMALGATEHEFHRRVTAWVGRLRAKDEARLLTCSITELGFVRVLAQTSIYQFTIPTARTLLMRLKSEDAALFEFLPDPHDASRLPGWVQHSKQVTDGHLVQLAKSNSAVLATLDTKIPGAYLIPA
jgi:predicted nucleic acid-binding protein